MPSYRLLSESSTATLPGGVAELRGWEVRDDREMVVGAVRDAVLDEAGEVCYLDVQLANVVGARRVLLPIGFARPLPTVGVVELPGLTRADLDALLRALPKYEGSDLAGVIAEYQRRLGSSWARDLTDQNSLGSVRSTDPDVPPPPGA
ncbi:MAG: PRC-barrel domain-containing protein [Gemmatimonadaceae bacterium]